MKTKRRHEIKGFTLLEMLLVLTIISAIIFAGIGYVQQRTLQTQIDRTTAQMQQILNAGLSYYVANGKWPDSLACLQANESGCTVQYIPNSGLSNSWGNSYGVASNLAQFYVFTSIPSSSSSPASGNSVALTIAGGLPLSYVSGDAGTAGAQGAPGTAPDITQACSVTASSGGSSSGSGSGSGSESSPCSVVGSVNIPGQNLNNARAVNFAGLYHHGGCVPVPTCPVDPVNQQTMVPQVMIVPVVVSGVNDTTAGSGSVPNTYPISSFGGYAMGPPSANPPACDSAGPAIACGTNPVTDLPGTTYWRACIRVVTEKGDVSQTNLGSGTNAWGGSQTLMAITRCAVSNETAGSPFSVYSQ